MLPSNQDHHLSQRMAAMEKELAALATAMADIHQLMSEIQVETKKEREINYQELRTWAQSNNSLLTMISSAINAIDALKQKIIELPTSSTEPPKSNPNLEETLTSFGKGLRDLSQKIAQLSTTNQSQLTKISQSTSQHLSQLEQLQTSTEDDSKGKRYWIAVGGGVILLFGATWMTISNITPIATKMGWAIEKLGRIEKRMGIKTANDRLLQIERTK
jgi:roadblock/LC7 domain-containing protein